MNTSAPVTSPSGVPIAADFRDNLIIDRYDPLFADMRASKRKHLRSANSEDAVTWNVFRSLRQIAPSVWLPVLWSRAFPQAEALTDLEAVVKLWESVPPPMGLLAGGDEGASEIDVLIEAPSWVWFIEAKYRSDISTGTATRPDRDQVLRNLDVGSFYAGVRRFHFSLLIASEERSPLGVQRVKEYADIEVVKRKLAHRVDNLPNLGEIGRLSWSDCAAVLKYGAESAGREEERSYAERALGWLRVKDLG